MILGRPARLALITPEEVRRYRIGKAVVGGALGFGALLALVASARERPRPASPLVVPTAMRSEGGSNAALPPNLGPQRGRPNATQRTGLFALAGRGFAGTTAVIHLDGREAKRLLVDRTGRWCASIAVTGTGEHEFRAVYLQDGKTTGPSDVYRATFAAPPSAAEETPKGRAAPPTADATRTVPDWNAVVEKIRITNLAANNRVVIGKFALRGIAPPGDTLKVYVDATLLGRAETKLSGRWSFTPRVNTPGRRTFTVVDEITLREFGPLPLILVKPVPPVSKPVAPPEAPRPPAKTKPPQKRITPPKNLTALLSPAPMKTPDRPY